jgi:hypothetical protein
MIKSKRKISHAVDRTRNLLGSQFKTEEESSAERFVNEKS